MHLPEAAPVVLPADRSLPSHMSIGPGARVAVAPFRKAFLGPNTLIVADPATWAAWTDSASALTDMPGTMLHLLDDTPRADEETVRLMMNAAEGYTGLMAVGSGAVNDVTKAAASRLSLPYIAVGTAASMNGYVTTGAMLVTNRWKVCAPSRGPRAVVLDTDVLTKAPPALTAAGVGVLAAMPLSLTDWWLAQQISDEPVDASAAQVAEQSAEDVAEIGRGIAAGSAYAHEMLATRLVMSGAAMSLARSTAPGSGAEHLMAHLWDLRSIATGQACGLHGARVGVAACISAALFRYVMACESPTFQPPPDWDTTADHIVTGLPLLAQPTLDAAAEKHPRAQEQFERLRVGWESLRDGLRARDLPGPADVRSTLSGAGAPTTLAEINLTREDARRALLYARFIYDRYTVLDLAYQLGLLPAAIDPVLAAAGV
ncbi:MAG: iron-containing alcohol dehydrogenase [Candidatus Hydrogenedentota bacterium]